MNIYLLFCSIYRILQILPFPSKKKCINDVLLCPHASEVDENPDYDNLDIVNRDAEEKYFDEDDEEEDDEIMTE